MMGSGASGAPVAANSTATGGIRLELAERRRISVARFGRWIAARSEEVRRLVIQPERLHRRNHRAATTTRDQQRLFSHLPR